MHNIPLGFHDFNAMRAALQHVLPGASWKFVLKKDREDGPVFTRLLDPVQNSTYLLDMQESDYGLFFTLQRFNGFSRKRRDLTRIRLVFADWDREGAEAHAREAYRALVPHLIQRTSPGKFQGFWRVSGMDQLEYLRVERAIAEQWGADPKAGLVSQIARVPWSWHLKDEPHVVRAVTASPHTYELSDFQRVLDVPESISRRSMVETTGFKEAKHDPLLRALDERGDVLVPELLDGWVTVRCPWADEHTTPGESAGYFPLGHNSKGEPVGGWFNCFHAHCEGRKAKDVMEFLQMDQGEFWDFLRGDPGEEFGYEDM